MMYPLTEGLKKTIGMILVLIQVPECMALPPTVDSRLAACHFLSGCGHVQCVGALVEALCGQLGVRTGQIGGVVQSIQGAQS